MSPDPPATKTSSHEAAQIPVASNQGSGKAGRALHASPSKRRAPSSPAAKISPEGSANRLRAPDGASSSVQLAPSKRRIFESVATITSSDEVPVTARTAGPFSSSITKDHCPPSKRTTQLPPQLTVPPHRCVAKPAAKTAPSGATQRSTKRRSSHPPASVQTPSSRRSSVEIHQVPISSPPHPPAMAQIPPPGLPWTAAIPRASPSSSAVQPVPSKARITPSVWIG